MNFSNFLIDRIELHFFFCALENVLGNLMMYSASMHYELHSLQTSALHKFLHVFLVSVQIVQGQNIMHRDITQVYTTTMVIIILAGPAKVRPSLTDAATSNPAPQADTPVLVGCQS